MITNNFKIKPVLSHNETNLKNNNFYENDMLLNKLLKERLNDQFFKYADKA